MGLFDSLNRVTGAVFPMFNPYGASKVYGPALGFGGGGNSDYDISGEINKIRALYDEQRKNLKSELGQEYSDLNTQSANNAATRGYYSSPVFENILGRNRQAYGRDLASGLAGIGGQEAQTRANLLSALLGYKYQAAQNNQNRKFNRQDTLLRLLAGFSLGGYGGLGTTAVAKLLPEQTQYGNDFNGNDFNGTKYA